MNGGVKKRGRTNKPTLIPAATGAKSTNINRERAARGRREQEKVDEIRGDGLRRKEDKGHAESGELTF